MRHKLAFYVSAVEQHLVEADALAAYAESVIDMDDAYQRTEIKPDITSIRSGIDNERRMLERIQENLHRELK